ncbi:MAG TPA: hypothetical protein P5567_13975 [Kiritimatiellia bacterium]|nr:hypothetical protein [Kiritimatiellia bacterium]HRZ13549.1 hypothetical protein [Kiritimatiellia bacterium]HSA19146.1 hypothetical protein [Kiritimatiellia bacterium]
MEKYRSLVQIQFAGGLGSDLFWHPSFLRKSDAAAPLYQSRCAKQRIIWAEKEYRRTHPKAADIFVQSEASITRKYLKQLKSRGLYGVLAAHLFRAQKSSARAKLYRHGDYKQYAYDRKGQILQKLCEFLPSLPEIKWGWGQDDKGYLADVLYIEIPTGQVSFHSESRYAGPDYPGAWDGQRASEHRIMAFCDSVMGALIEHI